ncbi:hypothetical protein D9M69_582710 [compost metagenome]
MAAMLGAGLAKVSTMARLVARKKAATTFGFCAIRLLLARIALPYRLTPASAYLSTESSSAFMRAKSETAESWK